MTLRTSYAVVDGGSRLSCLGQRPGLTENGPRAVPDSAEHSAPRGSYVERPETEDDWTLGSERNVG